VDRALHDHGVHRTAPCGAAVIDRVEEAAIGRTTSTLLKIIVDPTLPVL
jgi:hypothetical protein